MRRTIWWVLSVALLLVLVILYRVWGSGWARPSAPITPSEDTTYVTEPLRPDGSVDYAAVLNQRCSEGVRAENNAVVLLWQAFGPSEIPLDRRDEYFERLGIPTPPEEGHYFVAWDKFSKPLKQATQPEGPSKPGRKTPVAEQMDKAIEQPWSKEKCPELADWLATNEKPLRLLVEASKRPKFYDPIMPGPDQLMLGAALPAAQSFREAARALTSRAMLRLGQGKADEAWQDLLACHRLSRSVGQGPIVIELLVAIAIDGLASGGDRALREHGQLTAAQIARMRTDLDGLPPMCKLADRIDVGERFTGLDAIAVMARKGPDVLTERSGSRRETVRNPFAGSGVDWDLVLRIDNYWYDRLVEACRKPTRAERKEACNKIDQDMREWSKSTREWKRLAVLIVLNGRGVISEQIGVIMISLMFPAYSALVDAEDLWTMELELDKLAFALAAYRADRGVYPTKLAELMPKYVTQVPDDIFSGAELHYRPEGAGYLLYSVGRNGTDDRGKTRDECKGSEGWDDLTVRIPAKQH